MEKPKISSCMPVPGGSMSAPTWTQADPAPHESGVGGAVASATVGAPVAGHWPQDSAHGVAAGSLPLRSQNRSGFRATHAHPRATCLVYHVSESEPDPPHDSGHASDARNLSVFLQRLEAFLATQAQSLDGFLAYHDDESAHASD